MKSLNARMLVLLVTLGVLGLIGPTVTIAADDDIAPEFIYYDYVDDSGELKGGTVFEATDIIRVIDKGGGKSAR